MNHMNIKKGDTVLVLSGKSKGKKGKVLTAIPAKETVIVEGVNFVTRHVRPRKQGDQGGILKQESPIRVCKVMRVCPKCDKPTRAKHTLLANGEKVRVCMHCGETI
ncbi:MAG: 50S ribosomal protein L24 [Clostridia bacterium]|nr:50S ribosomal protein L24 [Clostridia bacterium]